MGAGMGRSHEAPPIRESMVCPTDWRRTRTDRSDLEKSGDAERVQGNRRRLLAKPLCRAETVLTEVTTLNLLEQR